MHQLNNLPNCASISKVPHGVLILDGRHRSHGRLKLLVLPNTLLEIVLKVAGFILELAGLDLELADLALELTDRALEITDLDLQLSLMVASCLPSI